jgi:DNA-binding NtrC family response regulator
MIIGPSGTGKELVAKALHRLSPRRDQPFVPVHCGAIPADLLEAELFGSLKGSFTGADRDRMGVLETAHRGVLFLDEIGEMPPPMQVKLLRFLQEGSFTPVGGRETRHVDVRVICATHRDLATMVAEGRFRADLYYRLNVVRIEVPPLRERREDIPLLVHHFLRKHRGEGAGGLGIEDDALELLASAEWPGNVRELENAIESALALAPGPRLRAADLRPGRVRASQAPAGLGTDLPLSLADYERAAIERALRECGGDAAAAAKRLRLGRSTFYRKLARHGITPARRGAGSGQAIR